MNYKALLLITIILIATPLVINAQEEEKTLGSVSDLISLLEKTHAKKGEEQSSSTLYIPDHPDAKIVVNLANKEKYAGKIVSSEDATFFFNKNGDKLSGNAIFYDEKKAYEYETDQSGNVVVSETNIHNVICIDYSKDKGYQPSEKSIASKSQPSLQSNPQSSFVIYIDFDGEYVSGSSWNDGVPINAQPVGYSNADMERIWRISSQDFVPFDINVTTDRGVYDRTPSNRRQMVIITTTNWRGSGGVAYIGGFDGREPAWVFNTGIQSAATTVSHEVGHTLELRHDGRTVPEETYYRGHANWGPIMGGAFGKAVDQWSKGEYANANRKEDDLAIITSRNGFGYRNDDHGNGLGTASDLNIENNGDVLTSKNRGIIERTSDVDLFKFTTGGGNVRFTISPNAVNPNLDIGATLLNSSGATIATSNEANMGASFNRTLSSGTYYLMIDGVGNANPLNNGYSDYGSLGDYTIRGFVTSPGSAFGIVSFYGDCDFKGAVSAKMEGNFTTAEMGIANKNISSIKITPGYAVEIFTKNNFNGNSIKLTASDNCLVNEGFNDSTSSFKVYAEGTSGFGGEYYFRNLVSGLNLDVSGANTANGTNIIQWSILNNSAQRFTVNEIGNGVYSIRSVLPGNKSVDIAEVSTNNGANVQIWDHNPTTFNQQFIIWKTDDGFYQLIARHSGKVIDVEMASTAPGGNIHQWENVNQANSKWYIVSTKPGLATFYQNCDFGGYNVSLNEGAYSLQDLKDKGISNDDISSIKTTPGFIIDFYVDDNNTGQKVSVSDNQSCLSSAGIDNLTTSLVVRAKGENGLSGEYQIRNASSNMNMDLAGGNLNNGANIQQFDPVDNENQRFVLEETGDGVYKITVKKTGKVLDIKAFSLEDGGNLEQFNDNGTPNQQFIIVKTGDTYQLVVRNSGKAIEVVSASGNSGANVQQWNNNGGLNMKWWLVPDNFGIATLHEKCDYNGYKITLHEGDYTLSDLKEYGIDDNAISSIKLLPGYTMTAWTEDNFSGTSMEITTPAECLANSFDNAISSLKIQAKGIEGKGDIYFVKNKVSSLVIGLEESGMTADGSNYLQVEATNNGGQKMELIELENGVYSVWNYESGKPWGIGEASVQSETNLIQIGTDANTSDKQFILVDASNGFYQLVARHSGKALEVANAGTQIGDLIVQNTNEGQENSLWELTEPIVLSTNNATEISSTSVYPNPVTDILHLRSVNKIETVEIYDLKGHLLVTTQELKVNLGAFQAGVYVVKVITGSHTDIFKITKK